MNSRFEAKLKEKIKETLQKIQEIAEVEAIDLANMLEEEATPEQLESMAGQLEKKTDALTEETEAAEEVNVRKELRAPQHIEKAREDDPRELRAAYLQILFVS